MVNFFGSQIGFASLFRGLKAPEMELTSVSTDLRNELFSAPMDAKNPELVGDARASNVSVIQRTIGFTQVRNRIIRAISIDMIYLACRP
ncbi:hypothetical protein WS68_01470 [Burkholderia sp. TSV86]|nr:hypothetical protein WS68_01470 [Burkholderia sp. TSV86]